MAGGSYISITSWGLGSGSDAPVLILHALAIPFQPNPPYGDQNSHRGPETNPAIPSPSISLPTIRGAVAGLGPTAPGEGRRQKQWEGRRMIRYHGAFVPW